MDRECGRAKRVQLTVTGEAEVLEGCGKEM
jgi:hypothetical protein